MDSTFSKVDTRIDGDHDFADEDGLAVDVEHLDHGAHLGLEEVLDLVKGSPAVFGGNYGDFDRLSFVRYYQDFCVVLCDEFAFLAVIHDRSKCS